VGSSGAAAVAGADAGEGQAQRGGDPLRQVGLDGEDVFEGPVVALRPERPGRPGVDESGRDPEAVAVALHRSLEQRGHSQFTPDLGGFQLGVTVAHGRGAADHLQVGNAGEPGDHLLGHAVREIPVGLLAAQVLEGEDRHRTLLDDPRRRRRRDQPVGHGQEAAGGQSQAEQEQDGSSGVPRGPTVSVGPVVGGPRAAETHAAPSQPEVPRQDQHHGKAQERERHEGEEHGVGQKELLVRGGHHVDHDPARDGVDPGHVDHPAAHQLPPEDLEAIEEVGFPVHGRGSVRGGRGGAKSLPGPLHERHEGPVALAELLHDPLVGGSGLGGFPAGGVDPSHPLQHHRGPHGPVGMPGELDVGQVPSVLLERLVEPSRLLQRDPPFGIQNAVRGARLKLAVHPLE
jgi:hypothetical protein